MFGWAGEILRIKLDVGKVIREPLKRELRLQYIGGIGFTTKILFDELKVGTDPLSPMNKLVIAVGPCDGTTVPGSSRCTIAAKSPLSNFIGDSNAGGKIGAELKYAGYDLVVIEGRSKRPVCIIIEDDEVNLENAESYIGTTTSKTCEIIKRDHANPEMCVLAVGPAGENLVKFACIISDDGRAFGRCGLGAVMGSKNLKAIAVFGSKGIKVANPQRLEEAVKEMHNIYCENKEWLEQRRKYGPLASILRYNELGILPTKNYQTGVFEGIEKLSHEQLRNMYYASPRACFSCPIGCDNYWVIDNDPYLGTYVNGFELMQLEMFGPRLGVDNLNAVIKMHKTANELGLDVADLSGVIAFTMECLEKGILTENTVGMRLNWGDYEKVFDIMQKIAYRKDFGKILAEGLKKASELIGRGSEKYAMHVKGLSLDTLDPRGMKGWGLGYAISSRGADHCRHLFVSERDFGDPLTVEGKAEGIVWHENIRAFQNTLEICEFCTMYGKMNTPEILVKFLSGVTGLNIKTKDVMIVGERIVNLARAFNVREGLTKKDDNLPDRFLKDPMPEGRAKGHVVELQFMVNRYYELRGWDIATGLQTRKKLAELKMNSVIKGLEKVGKLK